MSKKKVVLLVLIGISIAIVSLYATYTINVEVRESTPIAYDMAINFEVNGTSAEEYGVGSGIFSSRSTGWGNMPTTRTSIASFSS